LRISQQKNSNFSQILQTQAKKKNSLKFPFPFVKKRTTKLVKEKNHWLEVGSAQGPPSVFFGNFVV
jgi:hypothetical protein